jgi:hypothetical protein
MSTSSSPEPVTMWPPWQERRKVADRWSAELQSVRKTQMALVLIWDGAKVRTVSSYLEEGWKQILSRTFRKECSPANTSVLAQWDPWQTCELQSQDNESVLFRATKFVLICYSSNRKLVSSRFLNSQAVLAGPQEGGHSVTPSLSEKLAGVAFGVLSYVKSL